MTIQSDLFPEKKGKTLWHIVGKVARPVGLIVGSALVDLGLLDGALYHALAAVLRVL